MSKNQVDVIIDIETLGTDVDAKVIAVGAVALVNGGLREKRLSDGMYETWRSQHMLHQLTSSMGANSRRSVTNATIDWWAAQPEALRDFHSTPESSDLTYALKELSGWCQGLADNYDTDIRPWGNGSVFDVSILEHAFKQCGLDIPWQFWNIRDVRTLIEAAGINKKDFEFQGTQHYALDDAYHEARLVSAAMTKLRGIADE